MIFFAGLVAGWLSFLFFLFLIGRGDDDTTVMFEDIHGDGIPRRIQFKDIWYQEVEE